MMVTDARTSPCAGKPNPSWKTTTEGLIATHPLLADAEKLTETVCSAWDALWHTEIGGPGVAIPFEAVEPRAQVVGDFFEAVLAYQLAKEGDWRRGSSKEKDLIYVGARSAEGDFDVEIKTSGQGSGRIYGNRSYAQPGIDGKLDSPARKKRSGFYLAINFTGKVIYQIRRGWLDGEDWEPQKAPTGQMAGLKSYVYEYKLLPVPGRYYLHAPVGTLDGIGEKATRDLAALGIRTVGDVVGLLPAPRSRVSEAATEIDELSSSEIVSALSGKLPRGVASKIAKSDYLKTAIRFRRA